MKRCLYCLREHSSALTACPACGREPQKSAGFVLHAPDLEHKQQGFKPGYFAELAASEERSFWFRSRNELITWALGKYCPNFERLLEIGCGTAFVLSGIASAYPRAALVGSELFTTGLGFAAKRLPAVEFVQMDARMIPYRHEFDVIGAFDVLEHIDDDLAVIQEAHAALRPGGFLCLTVPQHRWLWSPVDEYACHVRRYSSSELHGKLRRHGFDVVRSTSFVSFLLPAMLLSRVRQRSAGAQTDPTQELRLPARLDAFLYRIMRGESALIRLGINMPVGGSRLVIARRRN